MVTPTGQVQDDLDYYPFGTVIPKQTSSGNEYQFTGYETDPETQHGTCVVQKPSILALGRYMRPDPYAGSYVHSWIPQSLNRYSYVNNRLLNYTDPYGLICMCGTMARRMMIPVTEEPIKQLASNREAHGY